VLAYSAIAAAAKAGKPARVAKIHRRFCEARKCPHRATLNYDDPCIGCPEGHFGPWIRRGCDEAGLGDKIERIARPIARAIDAVAGTKIAGCGGCKKMKERLNTGISFGEALKKRIKGE
jgi:hypothetical protein